MEEIQPGIFKENNKLFTRTTIKKSVYGEGLVEREDETFRYWKPSRSKAGAAVMKGIDLGVEKDSRVLYLGAASGTTVSHFSDILEDGFVFAVEYSDTVIRDLVSLAEERENIAPILANARNPEEYEDLVPEVDVVFQDISQQDQAEIFTKNCEKYLKENGIALLSVKARSISTSREKEDIFQEVRKKLERKFEVIDETELDPYEKEHLFLELKKK